MGNLRQDARVTVTDDLSVLLRPARDACMAATVLNLSEGGMLIAGHCLDPGELTAFELAGPNFCYAGLASVAHKTTQVAGLRFLRWNGPANRALHDLIVSRLSRPPALAPIPREAAAGGARPAFR